MDTDERLAATLSVFERTASPGAPLTASEVAEELDCTRRTAYNRLERLAERGDLETKKVGARGRVWWRPAGDAGVATDLERELDEVFDRVDDAFYALDDEWRYTYLNDRAQEVLGRFASDLLGRTIWDGLPEPAVEAVREPFERAMETQEQVDFEVRSEALNAWLAFHVYPSESGLSVYFRDVTDRKRFEETLASLNDSSRRLLGAETPEDVGEVVVDTATDVLDLSGVVVYRYDPDRDVLSPGERSVEAGFMRRAFPEVPPGEGSITGRVFAEGESRYCEDITEEPALDVDPADTDMRAGLFAPMSDHGIVVVGSPEPGSFDEDTRQLVEILAANAEAASDRVERERRLERQREQLAALDELNGVVRGINEALVRQSTREEIEEVVCERLADSDSYLFAWMGEVDAKNRRVALRAEAGVDGYFDDVTLSVDPDDPEARGPTGRAVLTREVQVSGDVLRDPDFEPWRDEARKYGYRSSAAIPVVHEGTLYGVLGVYAERPHAFEGDERAVVAQLGEVVGHAIASVERKRVLMSDEVIELEFRARDLLDDLDAPATDGRITFDRTVPVGDGEYLGYGTATGDALGTVEALVERVDHWEALSVVRERFDAATFELRLGEPPVVSTVASHGGYVGEAVVEDGDLRMTVRLPTAATVRDVVEGVRETHPTAEVVSRRQVRSADASAERVGAVLADDLTERQRATLEAAYFAGFFEWPRETTGTEVADSLGIADATFHQHVRAAERKLLAALLAEPSETVR